MVRNRELINCFKGVDLDALFVSKTFCYPAFYPTDAEQWEMMLDMAYIDNDLFSTQREYELISRYEFRVKN